MYEHRKYASMDRSIPSGLSEFRDKVVKCAEMDINNEVQFIKLNKWKYDNFTSLEEKINYL